jgi:chorismate mutase/prephenate dehydrogenase
MTLEQLRDRLAAIDRQIIDLVAERQAVSHEIGAVKRAEGRATRDFRREKQVIDAARSRAAECGVSPAVGEALMELLIRSSLTTQERARVRAEGAGQGQRALVIGGSGKMGRWFVEFLDSQGFDVTVADPAGPVQGFKHVADWRRGPGDFAVTVVATPLGVTAAILDELAGRHHKGLIFDIGSLKSPLVEAVRRLAASGARVTSLHPMFGPDTELLSGRHVLFMDTGSADAVREARQLFASTMAQQMEMPLEEHDRLIAYVLGLSHALNIAFFTVLAESGETAPRLANLSSTTFDAQLDVATRVAPEYPHLYL